MSLFSGKRQIESFQGFSYVFDKSLILNQENEK